LSNLDLTSTNQQQDAWKSIGLRTNFYLQYQAKNDLEVQKKYGKLVYKIASVNFPNWVKNLTMPTGKIRLGYISAHLRHHTVAKLFQGWLQWRNREQFEIYCYGIDINNTCDNFTREYQEQSDYFYQFDNLVNMERIAQHILDNSVTYSGLFRYWYGCAYYPTSRIAFSSSTMCNLGTSNHLRITNH
jgi:predicted O-linked N-acetylglucosamine transferase (SPINDLY family)